MRNGKENEMGFFFALVFPILEEEGRTQVELFCCRGRKGWDDLGNSGGGLGRTTKLQCQPQKLV